MAGFLPNCVEEVVGLSCIAEAVASNCVGEAVGVCGERDVVGVCRERERNVVVLMVSMIVSRGGGMLMEADIDGIDWAVCVGCGVTPLVLGYQSRSMNEILESENEVYRLYAHAVAYMLKENKFREHFRDYKKLTKGRMVWRGGGGLRSIIIKVGGK